MAETEFNWHDDGHVIHVRLEKDSVSVVSGLCPYGGRKDTPCYHEGINGCVVNYFVSMYGIDVNVGVADAAGTLPISWSYGGNSWEIDSATCWIIPNNDPNFATWAENERLSNQEKSNG